MTDNCRGVDTSSVELKVNNNVIPHSEIVFTSDGVGDSLKYQPSIPFACDAQVNVELNVCDNATTPNCGSSSYSFFTPVDVAAPTIEVVRPLNGATGVPEDTDIVLYVTDECSGVDSSSVVLKVNDDVIPHGDIVFTNSDTLKISYKPSTPFDYCSQVKVELHVCDIAPVVNCADTTYFFNTSIDTVPPIIEIINPLPGATDVPGNTDIVLYVTDDCSGIDKSSVEFKVNNVVIPAADYDFANGDTFRYQPSVPFACDSQVDVYFRICDNATPANCANTTYNFSTIPDTAAPTIEVIRPLSGATDVPDTAGIVLNVYDD